MSFTRVDKRTKCATSIRGRNDKGHHARRLISVPHGVRLNYATSLRGRLDATVNLTPQHVTAGCNGWLSEANHTVFLGRKPGAKSDGWFGFGGRRGEKTIYARAVRFGYMEPNGNFSDLFREAIYNRRRLQQEVVTRDIKGSISKTTMKADGIIYFQRRPAKSMRFTMPMEVT